MKRLQVAAIMALVTLTAPSSVFCQENRAWGGRAFVMVNVGAQTKSPDFGYEFVTTLWEQTATARLDTPGKTGVTFDVGAGLRLVQNLGVGVTYSRYSNQRTATLTATIPNPLTQYPSWIFPPGYVLGGPETLEQHMPLQRAEDVVHIQAIYRVPIGNRIQLGAFGGPSYFRCTDDHVTRFWLLEDPAGPLDWSVAFFDISQMIDRGSAWGYHGGGSFTYLAAKHVGVGMTVRYSEATHTTTNHFSDTTYLSEGVWGGEKGTVSLKMKHGGIQWNGGVSFHF